MSATELLSMCRVLSGTSWHFLARVAQKPDGLARLLDTPPTERSHEAVEALRRLRDARDELNEHRAWVEALLRDTAADGIRLTTVLDDDYPANLRLIHNLPPFLFYRGELRPEDARAVAVVGTRSPTEQGLRRARQLATRLGEDGVVVLSGLARGIDTAAHEAALAAGGRTIAVLGTGIRRTYPPENEELAERIAVSGALVSQFWPDTPPRQDTFPRRNIVMSGLGQGTVVVEAAATSGAKMQARFAIEHGKRVFLLSSLVRERPWAKAYLERGAVEVAGTEDILRRLRSSEAILEQSHQRRQLSMALS